MKEYFSHDYNSRNDKKITRLFMKHGISGIGAYWCIIEMLYEESGYLSIDEYERIAFELRCEYEFITSVINDFDLFKIEDGKFFSESAISRIKQRMNKSEKARKSVMKRWNKNNRNTNVKQTNESRNTNKVKESKEKIYTHKQYYDEQLKISGNDKTYKLFIDWLFGENILKRELTHVLDMKEQISWKQFPSLLDIHKETGVKIRDLLIDMENWLMSNPKAKNKTVLGTVRTFAKIASK